MRYFSGLLICLVMGCGWGVAQEALTAEMVLKKSLAHHDPNGDWASFAHTLRLRESRPDGSDRLTSLHLDLVTGSFRCESESDGVRVSREIAGGVVWATLNGSSQFSEEDAKKHRLGSVAVRFYHNYYLFLYGLPMKIADPGALLAPEVKRVSFMDKPVLQLKVTYEPGVGKDTWYFYFDPESYAVVGCRFYHDEAANDGEYIVFEGSYRLGAMSLPQHRHWYTNKEGRLLGTDHLVGHDR